MCWLIFFWMLSICLRFVYQIKRKFGGNFHFLFLILNLKQIDTSCYWSSSRLVIDVEWKKCPRYKNKSKLMRLYALCMPVRKTLNIKLTKFLKIVQEYYRLNSSHLVLLYYCCSFSVNDFCSWMDVVVVINV